MRGKVAKKLRRLAEAATVGTKKLSKSVSDRGDCLINTPGTTRAMHRALKNAFMEGKS